MEQQFSYQFSTPISKSGYGWLDLLEKKIYCFVLFSELCYWPKSGGKQIAANVDKPVKPQVTPTSPDIEKSSMSSGGSQRNREVDPV